MDEIRQMAARMRELREICDFTTGEVAQKLNIAEADYIRYETDGEDVPINVLFRLAAVLGVDLNELLTGRAPHLESYCLVKRGKGMTIDRYPGYGFQSLAYTYKHRVMEPLLVTVEPGGPDPAPVSHGGQEFNMCLEGTMELLFDGKTIRLEEGDSVYFNPGRPHGQRAVGGRVRFLTVITL
ncbi:MAG: XRE family transcriptional regulator [Oscillospiraceae bacterium]|jgi:mannose-6-phosphate isomerase-like protein (cupin superfamily)/DNA-binding XRE family transcriptional regulator|nr:XRE family transcriptional regulator [Oscillospiraceae bacterium]